MRTLVTGKQMKAVDAHAITTIGIPSMVLMERAAFAVAREVKGILKEEAGRLAPGASVWSVCGTGNNGADGIAAARMLFLEGVSAGVVLIGQPEKGTEEFLQQLKIARNLGMEILSREQWEELCSQGGMRCRVLIDAIFGVGLSRQVQGAYAECIRRINGLRQEGAVECVAAVDISSGVHSDTGQVMGEAVSADLTVTFGWEKRGTVLYPGRSLAGRVVVENIGFPPLDSLKPEVRDGEDEEEIPYACTYGPGDLERIPERAAYSNKGTFGKVLIVGGAVGYTGAPYLTAAAAVRTGCGLVSLGVPETIWPVEAAKCVSAMPFPLPDKHGRLSPKAKEEILERAAGCDAVALGPGLGRGDGVTELVLDLLQKIQQPMVLDADGINALGGHIDVLDARRDRITVLTPHDGEFARIGGDLTGSNRLGAARAFGAAHGCVLVLKGHRTLTAAPAGNVLVNTTGNSGLAAAATC